VEPKTGCLSGKSLWLLKLSGFRTSGVLASHKIEGNEIPAITAKMEQEQINSLQEKISRETAKIFLLKKRRMRLFLE
jgi:hypothetical protein